VNDPRSAWHNDRGRSVFPMLYGDSHVQDFKFPAGYQTWSMSPAPDPAFEYW
jgi:hypothetical protein